MEAQGTEPSGHPGPLTVSFCSDRSVGVEMETQHPLLLLQCCGCGGK